MAGDINTYALNLEFQLVDKATPTLDTVGQSLTKIEEQVNDISSKSMTQFQQAALQLETNVKAIQTEYGKIQAIQLAMIKPLRDMQQMGLDQQKRLTDEAKGLKDNMLADWIQITKVLTLKGKLIEQESGLLTTEEAQVMRIGRGFQSWSMQLERILSTLKQHAISLVDIQGHIYKAMEASEMFKNANYRLYDSQSKMAESAQLTASRMGILRDDVLQAYAALGNAKVPREELDSLAVTTAKFTRLSGVNVQTIATWAKSLSQAGMTAADVERRTEFMAVAMRKFGLDTNDSTNLMRSQEQQLMRLRQVYGTPVANEFQKAQVAVAAFGKDIGLQSEQLQLFTNALGTIDPVQLRIFGQAAGVGAKEMQTADGVAKAFAITAYKLAEQLRATDDPIKRRTLLEMQKQLYGPQMGEAINAYATQVADLGDKFKDQEDVLKSLSRTMNASAADVRGLTGIWSESNNTLVAQWRIMYSTFQGVFGAIFSMMEPALVVVMRSINTVVTGLAELISSVSKAADQFGPLGTGVKAAVGILLGLGVAIIVVFTAIKLFNFGVGLAKVIGQAFGVAIEETLKGLARGLRALQSQTSTMLVLSGLLLSLAAAFLAVAVTVKMLVSAVVTLSSLGATGIVTFIALVVALLLVAGALVLLGMVAQGKIALGIIVVAGALLAFGVTAYLVAQAVRIMVDAFQLLNAEVGKNLVGFGLYFILFAMEMWVAGLILTSGMMFILPGIMGLSIALGILAAAILLISMAGPLLARGAEGLKAGIPLLAEAASGIGFWVIPLMAAALALGNVALPLALAGIGILIGGLGIQYGAKGLLEGIPLLAEAATGLGFWVIPLIAMAIALQSVAIPLAIAGLGILIGGVGIWLGAMALKAGIPILAEATEGLGLWILKLAVAAVGLYAAATPLALAGISILIGGVGIWLGSMALRAGVGMLSETSGQMLEVAGTITMAGLAMVAAGAALMVGGTTLAVASSIIALLAPGLAIMGAALWAASWATERGATALQASGEMFGAIGMGFLIGGMGMFIGSTLMLSSAGRLKLAITTLSTALSTPLTMLSFRFASELAIASVAMYRMIESVTSTLMEYARDVEVVAGRIGEAFHRAIPSMPLAILGMHLLKADTIATTQPKDRTMQSDEVDDRRKQLKLMDEQNTNIKRTTEILSKISDMVAGLGGGDNTAVGEILKLLRDNLTGLRGSSGNRPMLSSPMSGWD